MLTRDEKAKIVSDLQEKFSKKEMAIFVSLKGVGVKDSQNLRQKLKAGHADFRVAKKTLVAIACKNLGIKLPLKDIEGPFGVVFDYASEIQALKALVEAAKKSNLKIVRALLNETLLCEDELKELASLPDIDQLRLRFVYLLTMPFRSLLALGSFYQRNLLFILNQLAIQKESLPTS